MRRVVVFPAPLGPRNPNICPAPTVRSIPLTASTGWFLTRKAFRMACAYSSSIPKIRGKSGISPDDEERPEGRAVWRTGPLRRGNTMITTNYSRSI